MIAYVLFGGMIATTWVQIVKAGLLLGGATLLGALVLARFGFSPARLFAAAAAQYGDGRARARQARLEPARSDLARAGADVRHRGPAAHPDALLHRARRTRRAQQRVLRDGPDRLLLPDDFRARLRRDGAGRPRRDPRGRRRREHGRAAARASCSAARAFLGFISAVAFATILAVVAGLTLSGAAAISHDLWVNVVRRGRSDSAEELVVARLATVALGIVAVVLGISFKGQNVAFMVALAFAIAASANFPALVLAIFWRGLTTRGAVASMATGSLTTLGLIGLSPTVQIDILGGTDAWFPLRNPALITIPLSFAVAFAVSKLAPEPESARGHDALAQQVHFGHAEDAP